MLRTQVPICQNQDFQTTRIFSMRFVAFEKYPENPKILKNPDSDA